jgi:hypothetical protein
MVPLFFYHWLPLANIPLMEGIFSNIYCIPINTTCVVLFFQH